MKPLANYKTQIECIKILPWDSHFFGETVGQIKKSTTLNQDTLPRCRREINKKGVKLLYYFQDTAITDNFALLGQHNFRLIDIAVTLDRPIMAGETANDIPFSNLLEAPARRINRSALYQMAAELATKGRFYRDQNIAKTLVYKLYKQWVDNSLESKIADYFFVLGEPSNPLTFVVYKQNHNRTVNLTLICTRKAMRGQGYGKEIINKSFSYLGHRKIENCYVKTQLSNLPAIKFYESLGFMINNTQFIFHKHV